MAVLEGVGGIGIGIIGNPSFPTGVDVGEVLNEPVSIRSEGGVMDLRGRVSGGAVGVVVTVGAGVGAGGGVGAVDGC